MNNDKSLENLKAGDNHYKAYVGPPQKYDIVGAMQFNLLTAFGIRDFNNLLDIGCGSLRLGKIMIPYLKSNNYFGMEPNNWLIEEALNNELGKDIISLKSPKFNNSEDFDFQVFKTKFDYIIAQSIFSHASSGQINKCLKEAKSVLNTEGIFLATFVVGSKNYQGTNWVYPGTVSYKHTYILKLVQKNGLDALRLKWAHPNNQSWYVLFHPNKRKTIKHIVNNLFILNKQLPFYKRLINRNIFLSKVYFYLKRNQS